MLPDVPLLPVEPVLLPELPVPIEPLLLVSEVPLLPVPGMSFEDLRFLLADVSVVELLSLVPDLLGSE